jgi:adenosylcobinamide-phosphate guanylyltransferase
MKVTALIMAGGKGTRMSIPEEKPMLKVGGKPIIDHVIEALRNAKKVSDIVVAVSVHTPKTTEHVARLGITVVKTPGKEYVSDMGYAIKELNLETVLAVGADLPFITGKIIDEIVERYIASGKAALAVTVPVEAKAKLGFSRAYEHTLDCKRVVPAGINVINGRMIDMEVLEEAVYITDCEEVAVNVNTAEELHIAEQLFVRRQSMVKA